MNSETLLIDNYFGLLSGLSKENKIKLIARLANSIVEETAKNEIMVDEFFGAFQSGKNAKELIKETSENRTFNHPIKTF